MILKIADKKLAIIIWTTLFYLSAPFVEALLLSDNLQNGFYPSDADSIGLGFFFFMVGWLLFLPFYAGFTIWALMKMPSEISLFGINRRRKIWSWLWTIPFVLFIYFFLFAALDDFGNSYFAVSFQETICGTLLLIYRAIVVFREDNFYYEQRQKN